MLERIGVAAREVRLPADLAGVSALIIPGGESTTIGKLLDRTGLDDAIRERVAAGMPAWGTCAGMILLARDVGDSGSRAGGEQPLLGLMDLRVRRNAFGGQLDSFETTLAAPAVADHAIPAVFIRAPVIERVGEGVEVLASIDDRPVLCRQGLVMAAAFHPELSHDLRLHELFLATSLFLEG